MKNKIYVLYNTKTSIPPFTQLLLFFNYSISKNNIFIILMIIPKFISILIITSKFTWKFEEYENNFYITYYLRKLKVINLFPILNELFFYIIGAIILLIEIIFFTYCFYYYIKIKNKRGKKLIIHFIPKLIFYLNLLFSQFIIEYFSLSLLILIKNKLKIPTSNVFKHYQNIKLFNNEPYFSKITIIVFFIIEFFMIVLLNLFIYYSFIIMNTPFRQNQLTLKLSHSHIFFNFLCYSDLFCIEYYEIFLGENGRKLYNIFLYIILTFLLIINVCSNIRSYEIQNFHFVLIKFFNTYNLVSIVFEFISNIEDFKFKLFEIYTYTIFKIIIAFFFMKYFLVKSNKYIIQISKNYLFAQFDENKIINILECFNYYLDQLILIKNHNIKGNDIFKIIIIHQKSCENENCKCKEININSSLNYENNEKVIKNLSKIFEFLMETTFINNKNIYKNIKFTLFLSEYYYNVKNNLIMSYSFLQSALLNINELNYVDCFEINRYINFYINEFKMKFKSNKENIKFYNILDDLFSKEEFKNNILNYCNRFLELIDSKIIYENSIKFITDDSTHDILKIKSNFLLRKNLLKIINKLIELKKTYENIAKDLIVKKKEKNEYDFYYIIFLFYEIFSMHYPKEFVKLCEGLKLNEDIFTNIEYEDMSYKFDNLINKFILEQSHNNHIIIKFSKGIKIKYISSFLSNQLNLKINKVLDDDFCNIFPKNIRIKHYKAMMHYIMVEQKLIIKKSTYIFDSNEFMIPCDVIGNVIPHYGKSLLMILNINIKNKDENYNLMINEQYSCISMSKIFEENYFLNMEILRKCDVEIFDLLNIKTKKIKNCFRKSLKEIKKINDLLVINHAEHFSNKLFYLNSSIDFEANNLFKPDNDFNKFDKNKIMFNDNKENMQFIIEKPDFIENLLKAVTKLSDSESKEYLINNLAKKLLYYQKFVTKNYNVDILLGKLYGGIRNNNLSTDEDSIKLENKKFFTLKINVNIKKLYDIPLFIFSFQDKKTDNIINTEIISFNQRTSKIIKKTNQKSNKELNNSVTDRSVISSTTNRFLLNKSKIKKYNIIKKNSQNNEEYINNDIDLVDIKEQIEKKKQINPVIYFRIEAISIFLTFFCIILSIIDISYQLQRIQRVKISVSFFNHGSFLEDKIDYIQHSLYTAAYFYLGINNLSITTENLIEYLKLTASDLINSSKEYYALMALYEINYKINYLKYTNGIYTKVGLSWKNETYESDMFTEYYYVNYYINKFNEDNEEEIKNDLELLFHRKYLNYETTPIKTNFARILFFLVVNFESTFRYTLDTIYYALLDEMYNFLDNSLNKIMLMEIFWGIGCILMFLSIFILYIFFNRNLFMYVISMFFYEKKENNNLNLKNLPENLYMKQKLGFYITLIKCITQKNKYNFLNVKNIFKEEKKKINEINIENQFITENKANKLKFNVESPQMKLLPKNNNDNNINEKNSTKKKDNNVINFNLIDVSTNLDNSKINFKKKEETENILTDKELLYFLNEEKPILNYAIAIVIVILFLIDVIIFYIHIQAIIKYTRDNNYMLHCFDNYATYTWTLPLTLSTMRRNIMLNEPISEEVLNFHSEIQNYIGNLYNLNHQSNFKIYDKIKYIWHQMNIPLDHEDIDLDNICFDYELCKEYIKRENSYSQGGTILGYDLIANEINAIINDYTNLKIEYDSKNEIIPRQILKQYVFTEKFNRVQEHIDIIYSRIQNRIYYSYFHDYEKNSDRLYKQTILLNIIFFAYEVIVIVILLLGILLYMKKKETEVKEGAFLFNSAFFKDIEDI